MAIKWVLVRQQGLILRLPGAIVGEGALHLEPFVMEGKEELCGSESI